MWGPSGFYPGTLFFQIYINDLVNLPFYSSTILYADDTVLFNSHPDVNVSLLQLQHDLDLLHNWMQFNKLTINIRKSKFMIVGSPSMLQRIVTDSLLNLAIGSESLDRVESYDYLGISIDASLNMEKAINTTYKKASNKLYLFGLIRKYFNCKLALNIFKAMVMPYLEYTFFLFSAVTDKAATKLQRLQNKGLRTSLLAVRGTPLSNLHQDAKILYVKYKIDLNIIKCMHRRIYRSICSDRIINASSTRSHTAPLFYEIYPNSTKFQRSLCGRG